MKDLDYVIVGAGPAGLQMGYFLGQAGRDYLILEASDTAGAFFVDYPRHKTLLSINKRFNHFPEDDFNLRHDWNSLLSHDKSLLFKEFSSELFPSADDLVRYLRAFAERLALAIRYNARVTRVERTPAGGFVVADATGETYRCRRLILATGAVKPRIPRDVEGIELAEGYEDHPLDPAGYENQRVAILGRGNSAFEVANHLAGHAAIIHLLVGEPVKHAWQTHYPGDLRAINNTILDMYQLKSLHATIGFRLKKIERQADGTFLTTMEEDYPHWETPGTGTTTMTYDRIIRCTGWEYVTPDIFAAGSAPAIDPKGKYPVLSSAWESSMPDLFFIGTAMQARDRRAASAFIHGFRYNVRTLFHLLEERYDGVELPHDAFDYASAADLDAVTDFLIRRLSVTSGLFQLFGFLCDALVIADGKARVYRELPREHVLARDDFRAQENLFLITLEYGFHKYPKGAPTLDFIHPADAMRTECAAYLHPVIRHYRRGELTGETHLGESLVVRYDFYDYYENFENSHQNALKNLLNGKVEVTSATFFEKPFLPEAEEKVFTPWPEEKVREWQERRRPDSEESECRFLV